LLEELMHRLPQNPTPYVKGKTDGLETGEREEEERKSGG